MYLMYIQIFIEINSVNIICVSMFIIKTGGKYPGGDDRGGGGPDSHTQCSHPLLLANLYTGT